MNRIKVVITRYQKEKLEPPSDTLAAWVIGVWLAVQIVVLCWMALTVWLRSDLPSWLLFLITPRPENLSPERLAAFQRLVISGCMAGVGGAVYAVQRFSVAYAYGYKDKEGNMQFLKRKEIARYPLVALSSVILGPITIALAQAGAITFTGFAAGKQMPMFTVVGLSFVLGFAYHDTLKALTRLSKKYLGKEEEDNFQPSKEKDKREDSDKQAQGAAAGEMISLEIDLKSMGPSAEPPVR